MQLVDILNNIDKFVGKYLEKYIESNCDSKVVHDAIWGSINLHSWEVAILDMPLLQRLRRIHQTGLAFLIYPSANHTRFEHSIGVLAVATKIIENLNRQSDDK